MFDQYTIIFKKNDDEITEAEGGDIIDVQLKITAANPTRYEIFNFNRRLELTTQDDLIFVNAEYITDSLTNSLGNKEWTTSPDTFLKPFDQGGPGSTRRSLTYEINFKIRLSTANLFNEKKATVTVKQSGFRVTNNVTGNPNKQFNQKKSFNLTIKPKINKWVVRGAALLAIVSASSNQENNN